MVALPWSVLVPMGHAAAQDCSIGRDGWDDIQRFRRCLEEYDPDRWSDPWLLHKASRQTSNPTIIRLLLQQGWDPNAPDDDGVSPLHHGARNSNPMVVTHLVDAGANLSARDNEGYTALHWAAAQSGNGRLVKALLDGGADPFAESNDGRTPLHSALRYRAERSVVSRMLDAGADEHLTPLQLSALQDDVAAVEQLLAEGADPNETELYGWGPLHFAVPLAGLEVVSALLAAGADPEARTVSGATALHLGASQATVSVVSALLSGGADPNAREGEAGESALHYAAELQEEGLLPVVTSLLDAGADPGSSNNYGNTPLHRALVNPAVTIPVVRALLDAGADPMARNQWESTPLHVAADVLDDIGIIETLLAAGADVRAENENGNRPVDVAWDIRGSAAWWRLVVPVGTLTPGRTFNGSLSSSDAVWEGGSHYDMWAVTARAGQRVIIDMESDDVDAYLRVLRKDGTMVAFPEDNDHH
ncbi:MAG: ankyrin repeat domain-containing protein [Bryobacterales bacterium]|nr:ankyrin repeat domain-containing protein [Bryobacterales bacterium]